MRNKKRRYNRGEIDRLFRQYVETGSNEVFEQLIDSCEPLIDIVLIKYTKHIRHLSDIKQEVKLKLLQHKRNPMQMEKYLAAGPASYLFFVIRAYARIAYEEMKQQFGESYEATFSSYSKTLLSSIQDDLLDPEILYMVRKELPKELFASCKKSILVDRRLMEEPEKMEKVIQLVKQEIEEDFGPQPDLE